MTALWLSRLRLSRDAPIAALAPLLLPPGDARVAAGHRLVWALFSDGEERRRDFLWREEAPGRFLALSARPPVAMDLFDVETKAFEPALASGDRLGFVLRANAVVSRSAGPGKRGRRHDVVMDALRNLPHGQRAGARLAAVASVGQAWLQRQGEAAGFQLEQGLAVDGHDRVSIERDGARPATFGVLDFSGTLRVQDPGRFLASIPAGFGRARAFGCGLMLIRRV